MSTRGSPNILIISASDDLHALAVQRQLVEVGARCGVLGVDRVPHSGALHWSSTAACSSVTCSDGSLFHVTEIDAIWWRRVKAPHKEADVATDPAVAELITSECRFALVGALETDFRGVWVNDPRATDRAENKLVQLRAASRSGLRVPETIVSQMPAVIRDFADRMRRELIVKPVRGSTRFPLLTQRVTAEHLRSDRVLRASPAIYQRRIPGSEHLRVNVFGEDCHAVRITAHELDWRANMLVDFEPVRLTGDLTRMLCDVLRALGLRMGIFDLKRDESGETYFLEVNAQGQFLFLEPVAGVPLLSLFAEFLLRQASTGSSN